MFFFLAILFLYLGRKIGWALSRGFFYPAQAVLSLAGLLVWGVLVGFAISALIAWQHPGAFAKWVFGFCLGAYIAIPNYGLFQESMISDEAQLRHATVRTVPLLAYLATELAIQAIGV